MYFSFKKRLASLVLAFLMVAGCFAHVSVFAADRNVEIILQDMTSDPSTLAGEAKVKVSVKGAKGDVSIAQVLLGFEGDLKYKSITFLKGENDPENGAAIISPNSALANSKKEVMPSVMSLFDPIEFDQTTDLFIITFSGEAGKKATISLGDLDRTQITVDGTKYSPKSSPRALTVTANAKNTSGVDATVKLVLDEVTGFAVTSGDGYSDSGISLSIVSEDTEGYSIYTVLNNISELDGGHRANASVPTFIVTNTLRADDTYTIELSGIGFVTVKKTGVRFSEDSALLEIRNNEFIPGDIYPVGDPDGKVDGNDKKLCAEIVDAGTNDAAADFNRDGKVNRYDFEVYKNVADLPSDDTDVPSDGNTSDGDDNTSGDDNNSGSGSAGNGSGGTSGGGSGSGSGGSSGGGGAPSGGGSSGGGFGGGSSGGGAGFGGGATTPSTNEPFVDLGNHLWAKESIYTLKNKGIISGVSATEYAPANNIRRGDFILILVRMLGISNAYTENFADVPQDSYYYDAIGKAKAAGIATGDGTNFMPENSITRQDLITLAYRAFLNLGYISETTDTSVLDSFADKASISEYALSPMASMVSAGIIKGDNGNVNPLGNATRAEVAVMCARLLALMN